MNKNFSFIWEGWKGMVVESTFSECRYIATTKEDWDHRIETWAEEMTESHGDTDCPCPVLVGNTIFNGENDIYKTISGKEEHGKI